MSHLHTGARFLSPPNARLDRQKPRKSTQNGLILLHRLVSKMDKVELKNACFLTASQTKERRPESRTDHQEKHLELLRQY
jgi:hypothetical protein